MKDIEKNTSEVETTAQAAPEEEAPASKEAEKDTPEEAAGSAAEASGKDDPEEKDAESSQTDAADSQDAKGGARKFFSKKIEKKDKKDEKIEELYMVGARDVIEKLLPVVDNFERGLAGADISDPFADGMNKIYKQLTAMLTDLGVTPIESVGTEFDPNLHNAVMHVEDENVGENIVVEEFQKGYKYKDSVVRHSMVKVAN